MSQRAIPHKIESFKICFIFAIFNIYCYNVFTKNMLKFSKGILRFSQNQNTYSAYPVRERRISGNVDTVNVDTVEKTLKSFDRKMTSGSTNSECLQ